MKRKNEENLIKLAFGDVEPAEAARAKQLLAGDAEAQKLFAGYSEIREGLKQLHTPEHQLSTERLREAILRDGLKHEKPAATSWRWVFAPAAVAAAAMLITLRFGSQPFSGPTTIPSGGGELASGYDARLKAPTAGTDVSPFRDIASAPIEMARASSIGAAEAAVDRMANVEAIEPPATPAAPAMSKASLVAKVEAPAAADSTPALTPEDISNLAMDGALPAGAVAMSAESSEVQPIVLIGMESDESTGANRATEVSSASNVIVGG